MAVERLRQLSAHEIGHTIGLMHNYAASVSNRASVMDYPHPLARVNAAGKIDLSNAYDQKIGDWDKVSIAFGYSDFPTGTNESASLNKILTDAAAKGLQFISDQDARRPGGLHPQAHLWDNGSDAVTELKEVMKVRNVALSNFSEKNIRSGMPMAMLEDVLIPVYFAHRYQVEAVSKMVGGMYYTYALRGDGQTVTKALSKGEQLKALNVLIDCLDPKFLQLPERIAQLIPPRPAGYDFSRELFKKRTGLAFDVLTPAETAADLPLSFIFNSERLNRMMQYEAANNGLGVYEMVNTLITKTWKSPRLAGIEKLIQSQTEQILLTYLLAASVNDNNSYLVKSVLLKGLAEFKTFIEAQQKATSDELTKGHFMLALERMKEPAAAKPTIHKEAPPGSPIGCDWD